MAGLIQNVVLTEAFWEILLENGSKTYTSRITLPLHPQHP
jgi:hypothetical protein